MVNVTPKQLGKNVRMSFGKITEPLEMPNLIEVQKNSYKWFKEEGLREVFREMTAITDYNGNLVLNFKDYRFDDTPKYSLAECKSRGATYQVAMRATATLANKETGAVSESEIYMGDFPLMTDSGTFVINGAERVIVSQLVRSPGVYYSFTKDKTGKDLFSSQIIPNRGAWLEYEQDSNDVVYVRIDKNRKIPLTTFIRALGEEGTDEEIMEIYGDDGWIKVSRGNYKASDKRLEMTGPMTDNNIPYYSNDKHYRAFIDAVKTRIDPNTPVEVGHSSNVFCILGNIAMELGRPVVWNPIVQKFMHDPEATKLLHYDYRPAYKNALDI